MTDLLDKVAALLRRADRLLFVTGAGVSADSGLPTYRGIGGLYDGVTSDAGPPIEQILSGPMLRADSALCWTHNPGVSAISDQVPWRLRERAASALRALQARLDA